MKFVIIPDSFKGTLTSEQVCGILKNKIQEHFPFCKCIMVPVADGGEGTVDCFLNALHGEKITVMCNNPYMENMESYIGIVHGDTAIVEMASCAGLPLIPGRENPMKTTTYGVGQLIQAALDQNVRNMIIGLGGSSTNDFGCGALCALGVEFFDGKGNSFLPVGGTLVDIVDFSTEKIDKRLRNVKITIMCDVKNPIYGKNGAAYIYAKQKGASENEIALLDQGLKHITDLVQKKTHMNIENQEGLGAAGAMAGGLCAFLNCNVKMGIETVLDEVDFENLVDEDTIVFTGEGKTDAQSLMGKAIYGIAKRAKKKNAKVIVISGGIEDEQLSDIYDLGVTSVFSINRLPQDFSVSKSNSEKNLAYTMDNVCRLLKAKGALY